MPDDRDVCHAERVEHAPDELGLSGRAVVTLGAARPTEAFQVDRDHSMVRCNIGNHTCPAVERCAVAMDEHDRRSGADVAISDVDPLDIDERGIARCTR
jgi:hypothetical protein